MAKLKVTINEVGMVTVLDTRDTPVTQEEYQKRASETNTLIAEIEADDSITEKEIEVS